MKSVLMSIRPKWCELIASGKKTIEVRKTKPKIEGAFKVYIYQTKGKWIYKLLERLGLSQGKVIGEFVCDEIYMLAPINHVPKEIDVEKESCLTRTQIVSYLKGKGYAWHISNLVIYDKPKKLKEFKGCCKYKNDDGSCPTKKMSCYYQKFDFNPDGSLNFAECVKLLTRPPQSWCYCEEVSI